MRSYLLIANVLLGLTIVGCGGPSLPPSVPVVTGTIRLNGTALADAEVTFTAMEGVPGPERTRTGKTDSQGKFKLEKLYQAEYMVRVNKFAEVDPAKAPANPGDSQLAKYSGDSPLRAKVSPKDIDFPFDLTP